MSVEVSGGVESDIAKSLHDVSFSLESSGQSNHVHVLFGIAEEIDTVVDTSASCGDSSMDTT
jgi:hypothetical protein